MTRVQEKTREFWSETIDRGEKAIEKVSGDVEKKIERFLYVALRGRAFIAGTHVDNSKANELIPLLQTPAREEPGTFAFVFQPSLWGRSIGSVEQSVSTSRGPDLETNYRVRKQPFPAAGTFRLVKAAEFVRWPMFGQPEIRLTPNRLKLRDNGVRH